MPGDYTRLTFDPLRDRAMVLEQQGRVHLDADFNELVAILERRLRVETRDLAGAAVVPATLPQSFEIKLSGTEITIGPGRMYLDGLLAENHGSGELVYDPVWGEPEHEGFTKLQEQPYGAPGLVPAIEKSLLARGLLVYLDVWQRERTAAEEPSIVESALGVDTCTRVQTVWQVRVLELGEAGMTCASEWSKYEPWLQATQPSLGRLSSKAEKPPEPSDPCAVAPVAGYRGLENRLYRVEIHDGGAGGAASFSWSRDNGAVASPITALETAGAQPVITVERLGRDQVLRFHQNDWVELLDDDYELAGKPGLMGKVLETNPTENTVTLSAKLTGSIDLTRNPRLRRWDQQEGVNANGVIPLPATLPATFTLEDGVEVTFELAAPPDPGEPAGQFKTGDWWVFAARAATASIEELEVEPPRGIRHHYARLAVIEGATVSSCRVLFPGDCECAGEDCECTACVTPETHSSGALTLQDAINEVVPTGGRVCVAPGRYELSEPLAIRQARSLTLAGAGSATLIAYTGEDGCGILVEDGVEVSLERFALAVAPAPAAGTAPEAGATPTGAAPPPPPAAGGRPAAEAAEKPVAGMAAIALVNTIDARVERCFVLAGFVPGAGQSAAFGSGDLGIGLAGLALRTRLRENVVLAATAIGDMTTARSDLLDLDTEGGGTPAVNSGALRTTALPVTYERVGKRTAYLLSADLAIEDNMLLALRAGVDFGAAMSAAASDIVPKLAPTLTLAVTRIEDNLILGAAIAGIVLFGLGAQELPPSPPRVVPEREPIRAQTPSAGCQEDAEAREALSGLAAGSATLLRGGLLVGARVGADEVSVAGNVMFTLGDGIRATTDGLMVRDNQLVGSAASSSRVTTGVLLAADRGAVGGRAAITGNSIREFGLGGVIAAGGIGSLEVSSNRIAGVRSRRSFGVATLGIGAANEISVTANSIREVGANTRSDGVVAEGLVCAVLVFNATVARVAGNDISALATAGWSSGLCLGVMVAGCEVGEVAGNVLTEVGPEGAHIGPVLGITGFGFEALDVRGNTVALGAGGGESNDVPLYLSALKDGWIDAQLALVRDYSSESAEEQHERTQETALMPLGRPDLGVHGNTLHGSGSEPVAFVSVPVNVLFAENRCRRTVEAGEEVEGHEGRASAAQPVVYLRTNCSAIVSSNRAESARRGETPVIELRVAPAGAQRPPCTVIGNIADGPIQLNGQALKAQWAALNIDA